MLSTKDGSNPPNLVQLECSLHKLAYEFGVSKVPSASAWLHDALNLENCTEKVKLPVETADLPWVTPESHLAATEIYVSPTGNDSGAGTRNDPFKTLQRAQTETRTQPKPATVYLEAGKYFVGDTLNLEKADSGVTWTSMSPGDKVILSGGKLLKGLIWAPLKQNPKVLVAHVGNITGLQSPAERRFWASHSTKSSGPLPPAPANWTRFSKHCMSDKKCSREHCDCADPPYQLATGSTSSFEAALSLCERTPSCASFALMGDRYELFALNNWSAVPNSDWTSYAMNQPSPPGPAPTPPPPPPHTWGPPPARWNTLHVDGERQVRARFPNGNPQDNSGKCFSKVQHPGEGCEGYLSAKGGVGKLPGSSTVARVSDPLDRNRAPLSPTAGGGSYGTFHYTIYDPPEGHPVYNRPMPDSSWTNNSLFSFWGDPLSRPGGVAYGDDIQKTYSNAATGVVHMFHGGLWGGWQYQLRDQDTKSHSLLFSHGGYQEARGSGIGSNHYFVENIFEELDAPGEWFHDPVDEKLYFWPNSTQPFVEVVAPVISAIVRVQGAEDITFQGITFTETRATFLEQYEVPSGGDWSVHRGAAFEIANAEGIAITGCRFDQVGGNAVLLSNHVANSTVQGNEFYMVGDSAIVAVGSSVGIVGTAPQYPEGNFIAGNHIHEFGIYGKQTSCYFQALGHKTELRDNLCYNGPRAGINWNDGFAGGSTVQGNLVFNQVRETGDHGPYNSWDRQPYLTLSGVPDGYDPKLKHGQPRSSILKAHDVITGNFIINGYNGVWTLDHDDGSQYFNDTGNLLVWGGCKNYLGNHKSCDRNVIVHPGIEARASGGRRCQTDDNSVFQNQYHDNNHCITQDGFFYTMNFRGSCTAHDIDPHVYQTFNNTLYSPNKVFAQGACSSFEEWQKAGQDRGSVVLPLPDIPTILEMGKRVLGM